MSRTRLAALVLLVSPTASCVIHPFDGQPVNSPYELVQFAGGAITPNTLIIIEAQNLANLTWDRIATARTSTSPYKVENRSFYHWSVMAAVARSDVPSSLIHWSKTGVSILGIGSYQAAIRIRAAGSLPMPLYALDEKTAACARNELAAPGVDDPAMAYFHCNPSGTTVLHLAYTRNE